MFFKSQPFKGFKGGELVNMKELKDHGAAGFSDDGIPIMDPGLLMKAMTEAKSWIYP